MSMGICIQTYGYILMLLPLFFFLLTLFYHFRSDLRDQNQNKAFLPIFIAIPAIAAAIHICL